MYQNQSCTDEFYQPSKNNSYVIQTSPELKSFSEANRIMITKENKDSIQTEDN